jgi:CheY-like chemotaxis protein
VVASGPTGARKPGILVAEDDDNVRTMLARVLADRGFDVWLATRSAEAIEVYRRESGAIDVVLLTVQLPGLGGPRTLQQLRALNPALPACFMTVDSRDYNPEQVAILRAVRVFRKPFAVDKVVEALWQLATESVAFDSSVRARN